MVIGRPSPAACSPLLVSRSTGPQPLLAERNGRSLTSCVPGEGAGGTERTIRSSDTLCSVLGCWYATSTLIGDACGNGSGAVTDHSKVVWSPGLTRAAETGVAALAVQPDGTCRVGV